MKALPLHRWLGLLASPLVLVAAGTAIALNHQDLLSRPPAAGTAASPYAGYALCAWADPRHGRTAMLVGTSKGLYRSPDGGKTWTALEAPAQIVALSSNPVDADVVYAASRQAGVLLSADAGRTWKPIGLPFDPAGDTRIHGLSATPAGVVVLTSAGVYRNGGIDWTHEAAPPAAPDPMRKVLQTLYDLHDGRYWGPLGVPLTDGVSVALIVLVLTGWVVWAKRLVPRRRRQKGPA